MLHSVLPLYNYHGQQFCTSCTCCICFILHFLFIVVLCFILSALIFRGGLNFIPFRQIELTLSFLSFVARAALLTGRLPIRIGFYTTNARARNGMCLLSTMEFRAFCNDFIFIHFYWFA